MMSESRRPHTSILLTLAIASALLLPGLLQAQPASAPAAEPINIVEGPGSFTFADAQGDPSKRMTVYTYLPKGVKLTQARIVFVMHGVSKNADKYRDVWIDLADRYKVLILAPLFDPQQWGSGEYSYASVVDKAGRPEDKSKWSFSVIEHLFDAVKQATGNQAAKYYIYGHSEGGQFVHRLVLFLPEARYARAIAANPGWYTTTDFGVRFPYGLEKSPATEDSLKTSLGRDFVLMLGDRDTDPNHEQLRKTREAMAQGATRVQRGQNYFRQAKQRAAEFKSRFSWRLRMVPGVAHENSKMARAAALVLLGN